MADETAAWAPGSSDPKIAFEEFKLHLLEITPRLRVVPVVVALNVAVFVAMVATGISPVNPSVDAVVRWGADYGPLTLGGQPWRLLTNVFLHFGIIHLAANMLALLSAGPIIERLFGPVAFAALYLAAGITGSVASIAVHPLVASAGASGAIFGIYGALGAVMLRHRQTIPPVALKKLSGVAASFIFYNLYFSLGKSGIDNMAHLGGLIGGAVAGISLFRPLVPDRPETTRRPALVLAASAAAGLAAVLLLPRPLTYQSIVHAFWKSEEAGHVTYNIMLGQLNRHEIGTVGAANALNDEILPGWRTMRATLERQTEAWTRQYREPDGKQQKILALLDEYALSSERGWERMVTALRTADEAAIAAANRDLNVSAKPMFKEMEDLAKK